MIAGGIVDKVLYFVKNWWLDVDNETIYNEKMKL